VPERHVEETAARQGLAGVFPAPPLVSAGMHTTLRVFVERDEASMHKELREHRQVRKSHHGRLLVQMKGREGVSPPFVVQGRAARENQSIQQPAFSGCA